MRQILICILSVFLAACAEQAVLHSADSTPTIAGALSRRGSEFTFVSDRSGKDQLYLGDIDSARAKAITEKKICGEYAVAPDGSKVAALTSTGGCNDISLSIIDLNSEQEVSITDISGNISRLVWSPNSRTIALGVVGNSIRSELRLWTPDNAGGGATASVIDNVEDFDWMPDSDHLVLRRLVSEGVFGLFQYNMRTQEVTRVVSVPGVFYASPRISPDGKSLVFVDDADERFSLYKITLGTREIVKLTNDYSIDGSSVAWSPDGTKIVFVTKLDDAQVYIVTLATGEVLQQTTYDIYALDRPSWSPLSSALIFSGLPRKTSSSQTNAIYQVEFDSQKVSDLSGFAGAGRQPVFRP